MKKPLPIRTLEQLKQEIYLLETLSDIEIVCSAITDSTRKLWEEEQTLHPLDQRYKNLRWDLESLNPDSDTFKVKKIFNKKIFL